MARFKHVQSARIIFLRTSVDQHLIDREFTHFHGRRAIDFRLSVDGHQGGIFVAAVLFGGGANYFVPFARERAPDDRYSDVVRRCAIAFQAKHGGCRRLAQTEGSGRFPPDRHAQGGPRLQVNERPIGKRQDPGIAVGNSWLSESQKADGHAHHHSPTPLEHG